MFGALSIDSWAQFGGGAVSHGDHNG